MSKKIGLLAFVIGVLGMIAFFGVTNIIASEPSTNGKHYVQVPHVVLPETIQYKHYTDTKTWPYHGAGVGGHRSPATYTPFPSYYLPEDTEFRTINQLNYPITPISADGTYTETVAQVQPDRQITPTEQQIVRNSNGEPSFVPQLEPPPVQSVATQVDDDPIYLTKINVPENPIRLVSGVSETDASNDSVDFADENWETPAGSIAFLKSQRVPEGDLGISPLRLHEPFGIRSVSYTEVAPPAQLSLMPLGGGFQQAQAAPAYGQLCRQNYDYGYGQPQYQHNRYGGLFGSVPPQMHYTNAAGLPDAWNAYFGAAASQQPQPQPTQYNSLSQLGGIMPVMSGQGTMQNMAMPTAGYGMTMQPQMQTLMQMPMQQPMQPQMQSPMQMPVGGMQQQTIGYILLYPQAAQSGVNMQLAQAPGQMPNQTSGAENQDADADGEQSPDGSAANAANAQNPAAPQMQAMFIPASQMPNYTGNQGFQPAMMQPQMQQMPNPMMMGGMNPSAMNPYMMGMNPYAMNQMGGMSPYMMMNQMAGMGMNPYMMNPMMGMNGMNPYMMNPMMGMGGMMPPIIIQMPGNSEPQRRGLFGRRRAAREESRNHYQQASGSLASLFSQPEHMPAKSAYPYGYFGVTGTPYQAGNFGGYHDMRMQVVQYPGGM